jgi:hypothetical protein
MTTKKAIYVSASGLSRRYDCDKNTVTTRWKQGKIENQAFLRRSGKLIPLFLAGHAEEETREAEIIQS